MPIVTLTANVAAQSVLKLDADDTKVAVHVSSSASLGGGTLSVLRRSALDETETAVTLDATLAAGSQWVYEVGRNTEILVTLAGATAPSIVMYVEPCRG
jgi:hypothetical protein